MDSPGKAPPPLANCLIYSQALLKYAILLLLIVWVRSFSKTLPSVKFSGDKALVFVILREKMLK